jgi:hypothetical protein
MVFPDVIHGFRSIEELEDLTDQPPAPESRKTSTVRRRTPPRPEVTPRQSAEAEPTVEAHSPGSPPLPGEAGYPDVSAAGSESRPPAADTPDAPESVGGRAPDRAAPPPPSREAPAAEEPGPRMVNRPTLRAMFREFGRIGVRDEDREDRIEVLSAIAGRDLTSSNDLTQDEATRVLTFLTASQDLPSLRVLIESTTVEALDEPLPEPEEET